MFDKKIEVKDLCVGVLGMPIINNNRLIIKQVDKIIIFRKCYYSLGDYCGKNIFTGTNFFFACGNIYPDRTVAKAINGYVIYKYVPLENYLKVPKEKIKKKELLDIYNELSVSIVWEETENKESIQSVTDSILKMILETNELVKNSLIEDSVKSEISKELEILGENYVNDMIRVSSNDNAGLLLESEYDIRMNYIRKLVEIEDKIKGLKFSKVYSLKRQFKQFKKAL